MRIHKLARHMNGNFVDAEVQNLTRQGVGRLLGLAPTLLRCQLARKISTTNSTDDDGAGAQLKRRRMQSSATGSPRTSTETVVQLGSTGCRYELVQDTNCLTELLMACTSTSALLPEVTNQDDLLTHMQEFASALVGRFPSFLRLGGDYIGPTVLRKHLIGLLARVPVQWKDISRDTLESWSVDRGHHLSTIPGSWTVAQLHTELGVEPIYISMWCCLLREVDKLGPRAAHACRFRVDELQTLLTAFKDKHGIPPCPYILVSELLGADSMFKHHPSRAEARSAYLQAKLKARGRVLAAACGQDSATTSRGQNREIDARLQMEAATREAPGAADASISQRAQRRFCDKLWTATAATATSRQVGAEGQLSGLRFMPNQSQLQH